MTREVLSYLVLGAVLLICFGLLLGAAWTRQLLQPRFRQQAQQRRELNAQWVALRAARDQLETCPRCGYPLSRRG